MVAGRQAAGWVAAGWVAAGRAAFGRGVAGGDEPHVHDCVPTCRTVMDMLGKVNKVYFHVRRNSPHAITLLLHCCIRNSIVDVQRAQTARRNSVCVRTVSRMIRRPLVGQACRSYNSIFPLDSALIPPDHPRMLRRLYYSLGALKDHLRAETRDQRPEG